MVRFYRPPLLRGVELVSARYRERSFPQHSHGEYVVGAVITGAEMLTMADWIKQDLRQPYGRAIKLP